MMESLNYLTTGFATALTITNLLYCTAGVTFGMLVGVLPGLGPAAGTALLLPITYGLQPTTAIIMLAGIYYGAMYGGTITSVLINVPGENASVITCLDGYALTKQGRAGTALGVAAIGSFVGGIASLIGLILMGPGVAAQALKFGPPEYFCLLMLGLTLVVSLMGKSLVKGRIIAFMGLTLSMIGIDPSVGTIRFAMGSDNLMGGIEYIAVAMGVFGFGEIFLQLEEDLKQKIHIPKIQNMLPKKNEVPVVTKSIARGSILGFFLGLIPGTNATMASIISYTSEKKISKHPEKFGNGAVEGVAGPETANNSFVGGSMVPLFTLGIPTSATMAILLGAFIMHGLVPGPTLFSDNPEVVWPVIASMFIGNIILVILNLPLANVWAQATRVPPGIMFPTIIIIAILGIYSLNNSMFDVGTMILFGVVGYFIKKADYPVAPLILTFILGDNIEYKFVQSMTIFRGDFTMFFKRPISLAIIIIIVASIVFSIVTSRKRIQKFGAEETE